MGKRTLAQPTAYIYGDSLADCVRQLGDARLNEFVRYSAHHEGRRVFLLGDVPVMTCRTEQLARRIAGRIRPMVRAITDPPAAVRGSVKLR